MTETLSPMLYSRHVDDIFAAFKSDSSNDQFLDYLNDQHDNLRFTMEVGETNLPFLDVLISDTKQRIETSVYLKLTSTNLLLNFGSYSPMKWKLALLNCF